MLNFFKDIVNNFNNNEIKFNFLKDETSKNITKLRN